MRLVTAQAYNINPHFAILTALRSKWPNGVKACTVRSTDRPLRGGSGAEPLKNPFNRLLPLSPGRRPVFCTPAGGPLSDRYVRQALGRYGEKAGIEKRVHPHGLRHSHAAHLAASGVPVHVIQKQLGHSSLAVTGFYLDSIAPAEVVAAVRDLEWTA